VSSENGIRERADLLGNAQVAIFAAVHDHLPQSLPEAMAAGAPTICTSIDAFAPLAEDRVTSLLVDTRLTGLAEAVTEITANEELRIKLRMAARQLVESRYSESATSPVFNQLVDELPPMKAIPA
jgi:glycosyltransferase involved in cell wall biosynthesis